MKPDYKIYEGNIFPIVEDGIEKMYVTDAPYELIVDAFLQSENYKEFRNLLIEDGYRINRYRSSIVLNFDEK